MVGPLVRLDNPIRHYAWGSRTVLAALQGRPVPAPEPEAELWVGAHPAAPSRRTEDGVPVTKLIAEAPDEVLGPDVAAAHGARLPFLLKILAAERPLSLQVHPSAAQAERGHAAEEAAGIPVDAPERRYPDPWPKPELLCALTPFAARCAFRPAAATLEVLERFDVAPLGPVVDALRRDGDEALAGAVRDLLTLPPTRQAQLVAALASRAERLLEEERQPADGGVRAEARLVLDLAAHHPADAGVAVSLLLHPVRLRPGEAIHLPAGNLHVYLHGAAVEVMAGSDNVLRGGLTSKHVDVDALLEVLDARPSDPPRVAPRGAGPGEVVYPAPTSWFRLSRLDVHDGPVHPDRRGPQLLLCTDGRVRVVADGHDASLQPGQAVLVVATARDVSVDGGGTVFRATVGPSTGEA